MKMQILQGLPGSGKSHYAETTYARRSDCSIASADDYVDYDNLVPPQLPIAHQMCFKSALNWCQLKRSLVIIDNTNLTPIEVAPYYLMGESFGYDVEILRFNTPPDIAFERQPHDVPQAVFQMMADRLRNFSPAPWWNVRVV